jgi:hypothetical protein
MRKWEKRLLKNDFIIAEGFLQQVPNHGEIIEKCQKLLKKMAYL